MTLISLYGNKMTAGELDTDNHIKRYLNNVRFSSRRSREQSVMQSWSRTRGWKRQASSYIRLLWELKCFLCFNLIQVVFFFQALSLQCCSKFTIENNTENLPLLLKNAPLKQPLVKSHRTPNVTSHYRCWTHTKRLQRSNRATILTGGCKQRAKKFLLLKIKD